jgi:hypothetical protein
MRTTNDDARALTITRLNDSAAILRMLLADIEARAAGVAGMTAKVTWNNAGDAGRDLDDLLDIAQRRFYEAANVGEREDGEKVAREMAITTARAKFAQ